MEFYICMAVALKLYRQGKKGSPSYRIVAVNKHYKADGKYIEEVGFYDPIAKPVVLNIKKERFDYWIKVGAQVSEGLRKLLKNRKV
ncbi:MAG: 30S ribosomal protein S16 [Candidatus Roizmanbacteria bacterium]|nr:30S ribosomal protein S16 [Candidatus Roizmanbacteria bacterium]